jgi:hypothetical protein
VAFAYRDSVVSAIVGDDLEAVLLRLLTWTHTTGMPLRGLEVLRPTLNDVFLGTTKDET